MKFFQVAALLVVMATNALASTECEGELYCDVFNGPLMKPTNNDCVDESAEDRNEMSQPLTAYLVSFNSLHQGYG